MPRITVHVPGPLRRFTEGHSVVVVDATTPGEALAALNRDDRRIGAHLFADDGSVRGYIGLFLNGSAIRPQGGLHARIEHDAELSIVPSVAGG
ncbi:MAG: MoaD/ThiS family protein [Gemmatimonadota bacterium]